MPRVGGTLGILLLVLSFSSCGSRTVELRLLTDRKELAAAVELYNETHPGVEIILHHVPAVDSGLIAGENPDLVVGSNLNAPEIVKSMDEINIEPTWSDVLDGDPKLVPLAYELPLIMGRRETMDELPDAVVVRKDDLSSFAETFNRRDDLDRLTASAFSPGWNAASYLDVLLTEYPSALADDIREADDGQFDQAAGMLRTWISGTSGSIDADREFNRRYRYVPDENLIIDGRILFARTDFASWAEIPGRISSNLDLRYFSGPRAIGVTSVVWGGRLAAGKRGSEAENFLRWLLEPDTQRLLINLWESEGLTVFGYLGGLSSIPEINESVIAVRDPAFRGMIPDDNYLSRPEYLPDRWDRILREVIEPWFDLAIYREAPVPDLSTYYDAWDLSSLDETN